MLGTMHSATPAPSAPVMSVAQIKAELRSRGVPEREIATCTERRELEDLLNALLISTSDGSSSVEELDRASVAQNAPALPLKDPLPPGWKVRSRA